MGGSIKADPARRGPEATPVGASVSSDRRAPAERKATRWAAQPQGIREGVPSGEATRDVSLRTGTGPLAISPPGKKTGRASRGTWTTRCPGHPLEATSADHEADAMDRRIVTDCKKECGRTGGRVHRYQDNPALIPVVDISRAGEEIVVAGQGRSRWHSEVGYGAIDVPIAEGGEVQGWIIGISSFS